MSTENNEQDRPTEREVLMTKEVVLSMVSSLDKAINMLNRSHRRTAKTTEVMHKRLINFAYIMAGSAGAIGIQQIRLRHRLSRKKRKAMTIFCQRGGN